MRYAYITHIYDFKESSKQAGNYITTRYDAEYDTVTSKYNPDLGNTHRFSVQTGKKSGDIYVIVETYPSEVTPPVCNGGIYFPLSTVVSRPVILFRLADTADMSSAWGTMQYQ